MDAEGWRRILAPNSFGVSSSDLRKTFANIVQKLCTDLVKTHTMEGLLSGRSIPLDKDPGDRPTGVGEVLRRIACKVIVSVLRENVIKCVGMLQVFTRRRDRSSYSFNEHDV